MGHLSKDSKISKIIADVPKGQHTAFKIKCTKEGVTMKFAIEKLITEYVEGRVSISK